MVRGMPRTTDDRKERTAIFKITCPYCQQRIPLSSMRCPACRAVIPHECGEAERKQFILLVAGGAFAAVAIAGALVVLAIWYWIGS